MMSTLEKIIQSAVSNPKRIVLPEAADPRIIEAAGLISERNIATVILIGNHESITRLATDLKVNLDGVEIIDPESSDNFPRYQSLVCEKRKHKGVTESQAAKMLLDPLTFGAIMVVAGDAHGCVAGAINTTSNVVRVALQLIGIKSGSDLVSSFFIMEHELPHQAFQGTALYADCALVIDPDLDQLSNIAIDTADSARSLVQIEPVVALLSFSTAGSANHAKVDKVRLAGELIAEKRPDIPLMTEVQFDAAIVPDILKQKAPDIKTAAPANTFIFPDLQSGNIGYKIAQRIGGVKAIGPILQGLKQPVNDLSRGCNVDDIVQLVAVTSVQSRQ
jgi:phosphate acetyltransferase